MSQFVCVRSFNPISHIMGWSPPPCHCFWFSFYFGWLCIGWQFIFKSFLFVDFFCFPYSLSKMALKLTLKIPIQVSFYNSLFFPAISDTLLLGVNPNKTDIWEALPGPGGAPEQFFAQKSCFPKRWHQFQLIWTLFRIFFQKSQENWRKLEIYQKIAKNEWKF